MAEFGFYAYPWNLHEPAVELARMADMGMSHVTVAASYHAGKFLQPRDAHGRVYFPEDGTVYFRPARDYSRLKPQVARITEERDILRDLCERDDMPVRAWTVLNHNSRMGWQHPEVTARNAFGDSYPYSLCPANPDVQAYAVALCEDLAGYNLESLLLETPGWLTYAHGYHHEVAQLQSNAWLDGMLGLCFCRDCVAGAGRAGIDASGLRRRICERVDAFLASDLILDAEARIESDRADDPDLQAFLTWRCGVVTELCLTIRAAVRPDVQVKIISTCQRPHATTYWEGGDLAELNRVSDGLELPVYQPSAALARHDLDHVIAQTGGASRLSVVLRPGFPDMTSAAQVKETVASVLSAGIDDVSFYNYGMLPTINLGWLKSSLSTLS